MSFDIVLACESKGGIGKNGDLPWRIPEELQHFSKLTEGSNLIMGMKTFRSIPIYLKSRAISVLSKSLPSGRYFIKKWIDYSNLKMSQDPTKAHAAILYEFPFEVFSSLDDALDNPNQLIYQNKIVAGGASIYKEALVHPKLRTIHLSQVNQTIDDCDTYVDLDWICANFKDSEEPVEHGSFLYRRLIRND